MSETLQLGPRQGYATSAASIPSNERFNADPDFLAALADLNLAYRTLVSIMFNCVPTSGHPGGSISSSRFVEALLYHSMDYDFLDPEKPESDIISYAAGHKALGLYAMLALRDEIMAQTHPELLPDPARRLRLEDLLGFRRNPTQHTELFKKFKAKALDGHPTPATPFVKLSTGASGVGVAASVGLAFSAMDLFPQDPPRVHIVEGEGGLTPGRVQEAMAAAATLGLSNLVLHIDWNQASIDSNRVCRDGQNPGDYVQWDPVELARFHDFNVIRVDQGLEHADILAAQAYALSHQNHQPTAIVYRTVKGWKYGIEGRASHGAGHKVCSDGFYHSLAEFEQCFDAKLPRFSGEPTDQAMENYYWELLQVIRERLRANLGRMKILGDRVAEAAARLSRRGRVLRADAPDLAKLYDGKSMRPEAPPAAVVTKPGDKITLREALGAVLSYINQQSGGGVIAAAADLLGSTSINKVNQGFPEGFYHSARNPRSRLLSIGGICEDAMGALLAAAGVAGHHLGAGASYGAFIAPLQHVAARLHCIGQQARREYDGTPCAPYVMVCAHAGLKTGEDGPTHADPQCLQLLQENFPRGLAITLTPWDPNEMWPLVIAALQKRPALVAPFVTRPPETVLDRAALGLPPPAAAVSGVYALRRADPKKPRHGTLVLLGSGETLEFLQKVLPRLDKEGFNFNIYSVASTELFDLLPPAEREKIFPETHAREAMGITGFTLPTLYRFVTSEAGRRMSLHAFSRGHYLGSGQAHKVLEEAGLDAAGQYRAVVAYARAFQKSGSSSAAKPAARKPARGKRPRPIKPLSDLYKAPARKKAAKKKPGKKKLAKRPARKSRK